MKFAARASTYASAPLALRPKFFRRRSSATRCAEAARTTTAPPWPVVMIFGEENDKVARSP